MASDLVSLADASQLLGVSSERVRQLVVAGDLPGVRFGNAWAVPGEVERYSMSAADAESLVSDRGAIESGVAGAVFFGQLLQEEVAEVDLYVPQQLHQALSSVVAAVEDSLGSVVLRVLSDGAWADLEAVALKSDDGRAIAPRSAVALDLMDSGDPRHWVAAENLVSADG